MASSLRAMRSLLLWMLAAVVLVVLARPSAHAAVVSIDFGDEWIKVGIVKPGIPFDVVLNRDSKRKTANAVFVRDLERLFGSDAVNMQSRAPELVFTHLKELLGRRFDDPRVVAYREQHFNRLVADSSRNNSVAISLEELENPISVEELVGIFFAEIRDFATVFANEPVRDTVLLVPTFFNQFQRQAILDAAHIAGLRVLSVLNENTAVALNYAMTRKFENSSQYHVFYDMGSRSTKVTVVDFHNIEVKEGKSRTKSVPNVDVIASAFDSSLGGYELDLRLQKHFVEQFNKVHKKDVATSPRAMAKLLKEANRVKQILSANADTQAIVENLLEDIDFKLKVTRQEFEELTADLFERVTAPIEAALQKANIDKDQVHSVILFGGAPRVPKIQSILKEYVGENKLSQNINSDEAAALGAVFRGAGLSAQFRVKEVRMRENVTFPIQVSYTDVNGTLNTRVIFDNSAHLNSKRALSFKQTENFEFDLSYVAGSVPDSLIARIAVTNLTETLANRRHVKDSVKIKITLKLDESGIAYVEKIEAQFEEEPTPTLTESLFSMFSSEEKPSAAADGASEESADSTEKIDEKSTQKATASSDDANNTATNEAHTVRLPLKFDIIGQSIRSLSGEEIQAATNRLEVFLESERKRKERDEARNSLEAFVYGAQDHLENEDIVEISTEEQRAEVAKQLTETFEWLYGEEGESASTTTLQFRERLSKVRKLYDPLVFRRSEKAKRGELVAHLRERLASGRTIHARFANANPVIQYHTPAELDKLADVLNTTESWLNTTAELQQSLALFVDPVLRTQDLETRTRTLDREIDRVLLKPRPTPTPKPKKPATTAKSTDDKSKSKKNDSTKVVDDNEDDEVDGDFQNEEDASGEDAQENASQTSGSKKDDSAADADDADADADADGVQEGDADGTSQSEDSKDSKDSTDQDSESSKNADGKADKPAADADVNDEL